MFILISVIICLVLFIVVFISENRDEWSSFDETIVTTTATTLFVAIILFIINILIFTKGIKYEHIDFIEAKKELYPEANVEVIENRNYDNGYYVQTVKLKDNIMNNMIFLWNIPDEITVENNKLYLIINED